jgi:P27 family predicted phage terminase small subunit
MGASGPTRTPTIILARRGAHRAKTRVDEPIPDKNEPKPPKWLKPKELTVWKHLIPKLRGMCLLSATDDETIALYCRACVLYVQLTASAASVKKNSSAIGMLAARIERFNKEFGLSPSARAGLARTELKRERVAHELQDKVTKFFLRKPA